MCGIAGYISQNQSAQLRADAVARMNATMIHRGPDDTGIITCGDATLGMRRLAIFDPVKGRQPMSTPDGRWHLVFNGAIYNFRELRAELAGAHDFKTECDTEVLLAAIARWGQAALPRLRGMFAFAAWDTREHTLFLARDPFGIKPLYISNTKDGGILFASELNVLLASGHVSASIDPQAVNDYLSWLSVPSPGTIYQGIKSLGAGEYALWREGRLVITSYDSARDLATPAVNARPASSLEEFTSGLRAQLEDTVRAHIAADVPVGAFLSGGLDSTALVALMTRVSGRKIKTFSIGFEENDYSESDEAAANAHHLGSDHHTKIITGAQIADDIEKLVAALDQPTGDGINTYYASQAARAGGVTVALSGLGGDELFGGYSSFRNTARLLKWLPVWEQLPEALRRFLLSYFQRGGTRQRKLADILVHATNPASLALLQRRVWSEKLRHSILSLNIFSEYSPHPAEKDLTDGLQSADFFVTTSISEMRGYMTDVLLRDSDVMSMRSSLELRVPFADRQLARWLAGQPTHFRYKPGHPKSALAEAVRDLLPPGLTTRKKRGFSLPFPIWMRGKLRPFLDETFSHASISQSGLFNTHAVEKQWRNFLSGNDTVEWSRVWSLAILVAFVNRPRAMRLS